MKEKQSDREIVSGRVARTMTHQLSFAKLACARPHQAKGPAALCQQATGVVRTLVCEDTAAVDIAPVSAVSLNLCMHSCGQSR